MSALANKFRVAIFDEFLDALVRIPRAQQKKVNKFLRKFRADPTNPSINYEKISTFRDPNMRTVRIDQAYRAVILKPQKGNVYVLLWVDNHDEAMAWATNKRVVIHPETGSLQMLPAETPLTLSEPESAPAIAPAHTGPPLYAEFSDEDMTSLGLLDEQLPMVRELRDMGQLEAQIPVLPAEVYEALYFLAAGEPLEEVRRALGIELSGAVDPEDFAAALEQASTRRRFALVTDDEALAAMLDSPLDKWRIFLHPSQQRLVTRNYNGPARVLGGAGTGKTVVAMHRARHLATEVFAAEGDRILFTTFTNNLASDIHENLRKLCAPNVLRRIEVVHLDKWVADYLRSQGYAYKIAYWGSASGVLHSLWEDALVSRPDGFTKAFFREEWEYIVQPAGCSTWEEYKKAKRTGRGVRLSRQQRKFIWPVFEEYRALLDGRGLRESVDAMRDAARLLATDPSRSRYRSVLVDEAQDMSTVAFELIRHIVSEAPNDLFIVGDGHQRIYRRKVVLSHAGVKIVGRSRKLRINYRTTDEIRKYAVALLEWVDVDDLDGGVDTNSGYTSLVNGVAPSITRCATFADEVAAIAEFVGSAEPAKTCIVARTNRMLGQYQAALEERGIECYPLTRKSAEDRSASGLRVGTMHRVKGLEFDRLVIAGMNDGVVPLGVGELRSDDSAVRDEAEKRERALLYVAVTRARREVLLTCGGKPSPWLGE